VKIPLPDLLRKLRERQVDRGLRPWYERAAIGAWAFAARRPEIYRPLTRIGARVLNWLGGDKGRIRSLPFAGGWTDHRDFPAPSGRTFIDLYRERQAGRR
jgi:L-lactate dehydrogenase complex protein LldF